MFHTISALLYESERKEVFEVHVSLPTKHMSKFNTLVKVFRAESIYEDIVEGFLLDIRHVESLLEASLAQK